MAAAAGGFIFCKASEFKKENLYNKIRNKVIDDCNIAKLLKKMEQFGWASQIKLKVDEVIKILRAYGTWFLGQHLSN